MNLTQLILTAQKYLTYKPIDLVHDVTHHYRVCLESYRIVKAEKLTVDLESLMTAAWFHDLEDRRGKSLVILNSVLNENQINPLLIKKIITIVQEHTFQSKQSLLESKILFDADKIDYVNPFRLLSLFQGTKDRIIDKKKCRNYITQWKERINETEKKLYFEYSRRKFRYLLPEAKRIIELEIGFC